MRILPERNQTPASALLRPFCWPLSFGWLSSRHPKECTGKFKAPSPFHPIWPEHWAGLFFGGCPYPQKTQIPWSLARKKSTTPQPSSPEASRLKIQSEQLMTPFCVYKKGSHPKLAIQTTNQALGDRLCQVFYLRWPCLLAGSDPTNWLVACLSTSLKGATFHCRR